MKKWIIFVLFLVINSFAEDWDGSTSKPSSKEIDGIEYFVITSPNELAWFAYQVNTNGKTSINAILENDIYYMDDTTKLSSQKFTSIGNKTNPFNGIIDGNGKSVYGANGTFFVDENTTNAVVKNLVLKNAQYTSVVDTNQGLIENVELHGRTAFGFAAYNSGIIRKCLNFAEISARALGRGKLTSGIAYENAEGGKIISCHNAGIFIRAGESSIVADPDSIIGGISVHNKGLIDSSECFIDLRESSNLNGTYKHPAGALGGIAAYNSGTIKNSSGKILLPVVDWDRVYTGASLRYQVRGQRFIASVAAVNSENGKIENSYGFLHIKSWSGVISNSEYGASFSGGIAGTNSGLIQKCRSIFSIDTLNISTGNDYLFFIGGLVGANQTSSEAKIDQSYSEMYINRFSIETDVRYMNDSYVGGIIGIGLNTDINDCHGILHIGEKYTNIGSIMVKPYFGGLTGITKSVNFKIGYSDPKEVQSSISNSYVILKTDSDISDYINLSGIVYSASEKTSMSNVYFDKDVMSKNYAGSVEAVAENSSSEVFNVLGKNTAVMQSEAFVETLNTNAGLDDDSGIWQYCEGNYPILVSEGTCEKFYSKYGLSSSSQSSSSSAESSSSISSSSVGSSSSLTPSSSSEKLSSSSMEESSSSETLPSSSSEKQESSSSSETNSSSSEISDFVMATPQKTFHLAVNGMTVMLSNTQGGNVRIFDVLGHLVVAKPLSATGTTSVILQTSGNYIVRINECSQMVNVRKE